MNEKTFRSENLKKKEIFRKWAVFPHFLCRLHRNRTKNVGNAPLAEPAFFSYTFNRKVLVLRFLLDDKQRTTEAQERTTEALAVKML